MIKITFILAGDADRNSILLHVTSCPVRIREIWVTGHAISDNSQHATITLSACCAVSTIVFGTMNAIDKICPTSIIINRSPNNIKFIITSPNDKKCELLINIVVVQLLTVRNKFSQHVRIRTSDN